MKKTIISLSFIVLIICSSVLTLNLMTVNAQTGTNVSGIIVTDTTWSKANSPYTLTGLVGVKQGVILTIEAGVIIDLKNTYLDVNGTLVARGTITDKILFNNGGIRFTALSVGWDESKSKGCIVENSVINCTSSTTIAIGIQNASPKINNNTIIQTVSAYGQGIDVYQGSPTISNNTIISKGDGIGLEGSSSLVCNNTFFGYFTWALFGYGINIHGYTRENSIIAGNLIVNENMGIVFRYDDNNPIEPVIMNNSIIENSCGIYLYNNANPKPVLTNNNIQNNGYAVHSESKSNINMTYNWWGTTDIESISQTIYDYKNNFYYGNVSFVPLLNKPNTFSPIFVNATTNTGGFIAPTSIIKIAFGDSQNFNITPDVGYHILDVQVNGSSVGALSSYLMQNVQGVTTISATFAPNPTITPSPSPTPSPVPTTTPTPKPTITPTPNPAVTPTSNPTIAPTSNPPTNPTQQPTSNPTNNPTTNPTPICATATIPTPTPYNEPTASPTQNITSQPMPTPTVPEFPAIVLLPLFALMLFGAVVVKIKNKLTNKVSVSSFFQNLFPR